ncbi:hypothetical protein F7725_008474 [Dissostichus mawsoni]|uniref:C2 domain-containing protein n=1 Tax=Dissostichus mawsoni TaxID=36200 RepID=A0A7J5Y8L0_DISMA|nr:hypothetical protein F7725_008474 [Dissostichus mawsoni]
MECLKDCCKTFMKNKGKEQETQVIALKMPPKASGLDVDEGKRGVSEDYLLSKLPPNGRVVPFVLPTFKASYIQPRGSRYPNLQSGPQSWSVKPAGEQRLSSSMFDLSCPHIQALRLTVATRSLSCSQSREETATLSRVEILRMRQLPSRPGFERDLNPFDLFSSRLSSTSSTIGSIESSLDSITLSGDERELGKVCVRLSYQEALEQVWITLVQSSDLCTFPDGGEQQKIGFKGIITIPKPIQFKSSIKEYQQDVSFMETFVFALRLQQLRCSALVLRLQTHNPKKRTVAECVLSLRQLDSQETEHWLELNLKSKSSVCHSELHLTTCFQPVNGRIQLQVLAAQNLPASSSPLTQVEMHQLGRVVMKKKTRVLKALGGQCQWKETFHFLLAALDQACSLTVKLYSRSSVRRKQCLGQVQAGFDSPIPEAVEQWKDTMANPEKVADVYFNH